MTAGNMRLLSAAVLLLVLIGCTYSVAQNESAIPQNDTFFSLEDVSRNEAGGKRMTLTIMADLHTPQVPGDRIERELEALTGTELVIDWVPDDSYDEKMQAAFATGSLPQAVYIKNAASLEMYRQAFRSGLFWEIGPLLSEFPHLRKLETEVLRNTAVDGKIYGLYQERPLSRQGIIYRKDWADRLGLKEPTTIDELYVMLKRFTEEDPDGNGLDDTVGLANRSDLVYGAFKTVGSYFGTPNGWGIDNGRLKPEFMFRAYKETLQFFRKLHQEGLMNRNFAVTGKQDQADLFVSGRAGVYIGAMVNVQTLHAQLQAVDPDAELDVHNRIYGPQGYGIWSIPGYSSVVLFPKSAVATEGELRSILAFYDKLMTPQAANLLFWGVEQEHYQLVDGRAVLQEPYSRFEEEVKPYQALQIGGPRTIDMLKPDYELPARDKAEALTLENEAYLIDDPTAALDSRTSSALGIRLQEIIRDATFQYIMGDLDDKGFDQAVLQWMEKGGSDIVAEYNEAYKQQEPGLR
ncbi:ABC transporter substrate-binding protein [Paenibacillus sambharensis]|uniref:ABC transporter substrate-binding protein n=1 Tax=Paenibacillus sambharensis TaxID=1803190 RepID=A0A2W1L2J2_9BACL|nr:extracellular solute-binding protein [Paenibacillus sambharensis]PZD94198.1 ABC transporter substrate-binding protein [Paenibacillus sambharensis]